MIGKVVFEQVRVEAGHLVKTGVRHELALGDDAAWSCPGAPWAVALAESLGPLDESTPADGRRGYRQLDHLAYLLRGEVILEPKSQPIGEVAN